MADIENLIKEIRQIAIQYKDEVGSARRPWPASIRRRADELKATGMTWREISEKTNIPYHTIIQWRITERKTGKFHSLPVATDKTVTVTVPTRAQVVTVTVTTPDGYQIQSGDVNQIAELISVLRKGVAR